jgi:hypothetical protein
LGIPFSWQSVFGSVAALAGHSRLVHRGRCVIVVWFTMTAMPANQSATAEYDASLAEDGGGVYNP